MDLQVFNSEAIFYEDSDPMRQSQKQKNNIPPLIFYDPEENVSSRKDPKKTGKKIKKARIRDRGQRKDKNTFPNTLDKLYRVALNKLNFKQEIQMGKLGSEAWVILDKKTLKSENKEDKETIYIKLQKKCAKSEMQKFLSLIRAGFNQRDKATIKMNFIDSVDKSIRFQIERKVKTPRYVDACEETISSLQTIKNLIEAYLSNGDINEQELSDMVFTNQKKAGHYNNGVKQIQYNKKEKHLKQLGSIKQSLPRQRSVCLLLEPEVERIINSMQLDELSLFDVMERHQYYVCPFEEWSNDINHQSD